MNPFTLPGPGFLAFYLALTVFVLLVMWFWMRSLETSDSVPMTEMTADPYRIAYLRAGAAETLRLAIFNLVDRGILAIDDDGTVKTTRKEASEQLRRPLDRELVKCCAQRVPVSELMKSPGALAICEQYRAELERRGLRAGPDTLRRRSPVLLAALAVLGGVAVVRIVTGLSRGRPVSLLVFMAIIAAVLALLMWRRPLTAAGRAVLDNLQTLTKRLKARAEKLRAGGSTNEALLLASVFGLYALPTAFFPHVPQIQPRPQSSGDGGGGDGSSSCSSGCGGGGGCGGCGGE